MTAIGMCGVSAGCGGPQLGQDSRVPVSERYIIRAGSPAGQRLSLPADRGFNIHQKQSSQSGGLAGETRGESDATVQGHAIAVASAVRGGSAKAEFKIGHRIDNDSPTSQAMAVRVRFTLNQRIEASDPPAPATLASAGVVLAVVDSRKQVVSQVVLVQADSDNSMGTASAPQQRDFMVRMEPKESYDVFIFSQVSADASEDQSAKALIELDQLRMDLAFSPATQPAVSAAQQ